VRDPWRPSAHAPLQSPPSLDADAKGIGSSTATKRRSSADRWHAVTDQRGARRESDLPNFGKFRGVTGVDWGALTDAPRAPTSARMSASGRKEGERMARKGYLQERSWRRRSELNR
jgi:hypothetical protein